MEVRLISVRGGSTDRYVEVGLISVRGGWTDIDTWRLDRYRYVEVGLTISILYQPWAQNGM